MKPYLVTWNNYSNKGKVTSMDVQLGTTQNDAEHKQIENNKHYKIDGSEYNAVDIEEIMKLLRNVGYKIIEPKHEEILDKPVIEKHEETETESILNF